MNCRILICRIPLWLCPAAAAEVCLIFPARTCCASGGQLLCFDDNDPRFPIGMGYVPMQMWGPYIRYAEVLSGERSSRPWIFHLPWGGAEDEGTISMQHDAGNAGRTCGVTPACQRRM